MEDRSPPWTLDETASKYHQSKLVLFTGCTLGPLREVPVEVHSTSVETVSRLLLTLSMVGSLGVGHELRSPYGGGPAAVARGTRTLSKVSSIFAPLYTL